MHGKYVLQEVGGKKSMLTDKEAQDIVGTMIAESI